MNIRVECAEYLDYPVVEWVAWFSAHGSEPTPLIHDIRALDGAFTGASPVVHHSNGDFFSAEGYTPQATPLPAGRALGFAPTGGRACDDAFPYFRLTFASAGLCLAIGWSAQWSAHFTGLAESVQVEAGQAQTHLRLRPGEIIRTPRVTVLAWAGDDSRAVNLWRRWYLAHILPRPDGRPMRPLLACGANDDREDVTGLDSEEMTSGTEANQISFIKKFNWRGILPDVWWIDAGWYPCYNPDHQRRWVLTGNWKPDPERFPNGLKSISDRAAELGADLLVWFEPERVTSGSQLDVEHPEWLLKAAGETRETLASAGSAHDGLLNLGNPDCRQWLTDHVCRVIRENGIKIYRHDHNFRPLVYWRQNEADDRQGMNKNLYVQGYLQYWDDLLARNPGLWIDSCASGGRRNDLETMRRSVPLHYTDYGYGDHPVKLAFQRTLYEWLPYFKGFTLSWDSSGRVDHQVDSYSFHCGMAPMLAPTVDIRRDDYDFGLARKMIAIWRRAADLLLYGDYYAHTPFHRSAEKWVSWQFDSPETGCGLVQGIRLPSAPEETLNIFLQGMKPEVRYVFEEAETSETRELDGAALLRDGFTLALPARSGSLWFYRTIR